MKANTLCEGCGNEWDTDDGLFCYECECKFWKDPQAVMEYFHFCGVPATLEEIKVMLNK